MPRLLQAMVTRDMVRATVNNKQWDRSCWSFFFFGCLQSGSTLLPSLKIHLW